MADLEYRLTQLRAILTDLESRTPQLPAGSPEAVAIHDDWMKAREEIKQAATYAEWIALQTVPTEVEELLTAIYERKLVLLNLQTPQTEEQHP